MASDNPELDDDDREAVRDPYSVTALSPASAGKAGGKGSSGSTGTACPT